MGDISPEGQRMNRRLVIVGAGGFGREVASWLRGCQPLPYEWELAGFVDDNPDGLAGYPIDHKVIGTVESLQASTDVAVMGIGTPRTKKAMFERLQRRGIELATIVHRSCVVGHGCELGAGTVLCPGAVVTTNVRLGRCAMLNVHASVGHDVTIGDFSTLSGHCDVTGGAQIGDCVFLGTHAHVLPGVKVEDGATIGAGSSVVKRVRSGQTVFGVPAKALFK